MPPGAEAVRPSRLAALPVRSGRVGWQSQLAEFRSISVNHLFSTSGPLAQLAEQQTRNHSRPSPTPRKHRFCWLFHRPSRSQPVRKRLAAPETAGSTAGSTERQTENLATASTPSTPDDTAASQTDSGDHSRLFTRTKRLTKAPTIRRTMRRHQASRPAGTRALQRATPGAQMPKPRRPSDYNAATAATNAERRPRTQSPYRLRSLPPPF